MTPSIRIAVFPSCPLRHRPVAHGLGLNNVLSRYFHVSAPLRGLRNRLKNAGRTRSNDRRIVRSQGLSGFGASSSAATPAFSGSVGKRIAKEEVTGHDMLIKDATRREHQRSPSVLKTVVTESTMEQQLSNTPIMAGLSALMLRVTMHANVGCVGERIFQKGVPSLENLLRWTKHPIYSIRWLAWKVISRLASQFKQVCCS
jgi:hypothetical protein